SAGRAARHVKTLAPVPRSPASIARLALAHAKSFQHMRINRSTAYQTGRSGADRGRRRDRAGGWPRIAGRSDLRAGPHGIDDLGDRLVHGHAVALRAVAVSERDGPGGHIVVAGE